MFESNILNIYADKGRMWLDKLPIIVKQLASQHGLQGLQPVSNLSFNYVLSGFQGKTPIILKLGLDEEALERESLALKCYFGYGAVQVLVEDNGVLLLERAVPSTSLKSYFLNKDLAAIEIACHVMKKLHQAKISKNHRFPHIKEWLSTLDKEWKLPFNYLHKARTLRDHLLKATVPNVLLHGDLHHDNILRNGDDWLVIDPKGVIGSPLNEMWAFVMDIPRDIPFIAQYFGYKEQDLFDWYFVHVILAACWNLEDNIDASLFLNLAAQSLKYVS